MTIEIAIKVPKNKVIDCLGLNRYLHGATAVGTQVERGMIVGNMTKYGGNSFNLLSPVNGVVSYTRYNNGDLIEGEIILKIKSDEPIQSDSEQLSQSAFHELVKLIKDKRKYLSERKVDCPTDEQIQSGIKNTVSIHPC